VRYGITDEVWAAFGPMVGQCRSPLGPEPRLPERMFFEAVPYWAHVGCPWRDLPAKFGDWSAVYNRLRRWVASGRLKKLFDLMTAWPECAGLRRVMIDSTIVRAQQHAAEAAKETGAPRRTPRAGCAAGSRRRSPRSPATRTT
jgi:putative transposase